MGRGSIMMIHGAWMTPLCWEGFSGYFEERGYSVLAPAWPGKARPVEDIRLDPSRLVGLGAREIVEHYAAIIDVLPEPPVLIGHSFGGLLVQLLLDHGLGAAGVALNSIPPRGVARTQVSALRSSVGVLANPVNRTRVVSMSYRRFRNSVAHRLPEEQARAAFERYVVPETGRIFFQTAFSALARAGPVEVDFHNSSRAPLLLVAGENDRTTPAALNRANYNRYRHSSAITDFVSFPHQTHWSIAEDGWQEVAAHIHWWLRQVTTAMQP